ncbi:MFS transporter [Ottowia sp.]|uniref:MFS transporter n=1 Tax=Ottowia sp. TaxID=1898956 RepID=UPI0039E57CBD
MNHLRALRPVLPILIGASLLLTLSMGLRQSIGIFVPPLTQDIGISVGQFTLAVAVQNLAWGLFQPFAGAWADRLGYRRLMLGGALLYIAGLAVLMLAQGFIAVLIGAGIAIGASMAATGPAIAMAVSARPVSPAVRSTVLGIVSAAGSLGAMVAAPLGQVLAQAWDWRVGVAGFVALALAMLPAAWHAGKVDAAPSATPPTTTDKLGARAAARVALRTPAFIVMALAYFVCGMQLVFLTTHLPTYLDLCGMDPMLSAQALGAIGAFNILGSLFFGWAGGRWNKLLLLGVIYFVRSLVLGLYFVAPPTPATTLVFASVMGFLWMGVGPLVAGWLVEAFGLRWQAMLGGIAFVSHQLGSTTGAFGGGLIFDAAGSYDAAWQIGVALGLAAGVVQMAFAFIHQRPQPPRPAPA